MELLRIVESTEARRLVAVIARYVDRLGLERNQLEETLANHWRRLARAYGPRFADRVVARARQAAA